MRDPRTVRSLLLVAAVSLPATFPACPGNPNTRGQMAVFIVKTFDLQ